jgi:hypothetical protein
MIEGVKGGTLASDIVGEQTRNIGKTGEIAQSISPSSGSAISPNTTAHDDTRLRYRPKPASRLLF